MSIDLAQIAANTVISTFGAQWELIGAAVSHADPDKYVIMVTVETFLARKKAAVEFVIADDGVLTNEVKSIVVI